MKVARVDIVPMKTLKQDKATNAELGTSNTREKGYIIGIMDQLKRKAMVVMRVGLSFPFFFWIFFFKHIFIIVGCN